MVYPRVIKHAWKVQPYFPRKLNLHWLGISQPASWNSSSFGCQFLRQDLHIPLPLQSLYVYYNILLYRHKYHIIYGNIGWVPLPKIFKSPVSLTLLQRREFPTRLTGTPKIGSEDLTVQVETCFFQWKMAIEIVDLPMKNSDFTNITNWKDPPC